MSMFHKITRNEETFIGFCYKQKHKIKVIKMEEIFKKFSNIGSKQIIWLSI